ncbi:hypothetical protein [Natrialba asiatica]|uniref:Uncharacterized protein n=1 Tax=Natrialba asiatica (strain ATCC 700177 / DSM 12278 / JCM 9576 / FERM P-10747 / NBRC 102637 / 172P1) TaxID=29540 RepID=M0B434_NATA1|nr:hypothetical protein [Natrialba asiatica]ELZ05555.1 hypothetical protein C481_02512 [Natrialba asiatica DSM 12278]
MSEKNSCVGTKRTAASSVSETRFGWFFDPTLATPYTGDDADTGVALGQSAGSSAIGVRAGYGSHLYDGLPGVSADADALVERYQDGTGGVDQ